MNATEDFDAAHVEVTKKKKMPTAIQRCLFHSKSNLLPLTFQRNGEVILFLTFVEQIYCAIPSRKRSHIPPVSHHWERNIIFKCTFWRGYLSSLEGISINIYRSSSLKNTVCLSAFFFLATQILRDPWALTVPNSMRRWGIW